VGQHRRDRRPHWTIGPPHAIFAVARSDRHRPRPTLAARESSCRHANDEMTAVLAFFQDPEIAQAGSDFGGTTMVHPVGLAALSLMVMLGLMVPRRWTCLPVILMLCFIPAGQRIVVASIDFTFMRVLMCAL